MDPKALNQWKFVPEKWTVPRIFTPNPKKQLSPTVVFMSVPSFFPKTTLGRIVQFFPILQPFAIWVKSPKWNNCSPGPTVLG